MRYALLLVAAILPLGALAAQESQSPSAPAGIIPLGMQDFARADQATVIQLRGVGPWELTYVNPADQPNAEGNR